MVFTPCSQIFFRLRTKNPYSFFSVVLFCSKWMLLCMFLYMKTSKQHLDHHVTANFVVLLGHISIWQPWNVYSQWHRHCYKPVGSAINCIFVNCHFLTICLYLWIENEFIPQWVYSCVPTVCVFPKEKWKCTFFWGISSWVLTVGAVPAQTQKMV